MTSLVSTSSRASFLEAVSGAHRQAERALLDRYVPQGHWAGHLSPSALSTAVAMVALSWMDPDAHAARIRAGRDWLARHQEPDGGWGDTPGSPSNPSTTLLSWAAWHRCASGPDAPAEPIRRAERWLVQRLGSVDPSQVAERVIALYGKDRTFSIPILTLCALCDRLGKSAAAWERIPQLPFELAVLPHQLFKWLRLPVVSYALPALIAIGLVRHTRIVGSRHPLRLLRQALQPRVLRILSELQPATGGFLEAVPLTGFVVMALAASGLSRHGVAEAGAQFLLRAQRADGSWPIDVNLNTWVSSLSVNALAGSTGTLASVASPDQRALAQWFLAQQHRVEHPFTHAAPGGWAWTELPGGVPDADDTSGVLAALHRLDPDSAETQAAAMRGIRWLLDLQNRDGGIPTFCRGWLHLPFDRSCPDITAHALVAWSAWWSSVPLAFRPRLDRAARRAVAYLCRTQRAEGTWIPLWFGSQQDRNHENALYGTARVLSAFSQLLPEWRAAADAAVARGQAWLLKIQHPQGGWGAGPDALPTIEETALAVDAGLASGLEFSSALQRGVRWLLEATSQGTRFPPSPIGLYFARLWYSEELYPVIFTCAALARARHALESPRWSMDAECTTHCD